MSNQEIRYITRQLIQKGFIVESDTCEECGSKGKMNGHHFNYDNPFNIIWLCDNCHINKYMDTRFDSNKIKQSINDVTLSA